MDSKRFPIFAERFIQLRGSRTQEKFADFLGISRPTVGFYENGSRIPDALLLRQIAEKCRVSADWLLGISDVQSQDFDVRKISEITGISEDAVEGIILKNKYLDPAYMKAFNEFFSPLWLQEMMGCLFEIYQSADLLRGIIASVNDEVTKIEAGSTSSYETSLDSKAKQLEETIRTIRLQRFETIEFLSNALDCAYEISEIVEDAKDAIGTCGMYL